MGYQQERTATFAELLDATEALLHERGVADGEGLVEQEDVRAHVHRHGEPEPHEHA